MPEKQSHKRAKTVGLKKAQTEVPIKGKRRLDARDSKVAREVERSGSEKIIAKAVRRLNTQINRERKGTGPK